jgi:hypothetical protein
MLHAPQPAELPEFLHHKLFPMWREPPVQDRCEPFLNGCFDDLADLTADDGACAAVQEAPGLTQADRSPQHGTGHARAAAASRA